MKNVSTQVGKIFEIKLDSRMSAGYNWIEKFDKNFLKLIGKRTEASDSGNLGASGKQIFKFQALSKGKTDINFILKRPWEEKVSEEKKIKVKIVWAKNSSRFERAGFFYPVK